MALNDDRRVFAEVTASRSVGTYGISPRSGRVSYPVGGRYYPNDPTLAGDLSVRFRLVPLGQRVSEVTADASRVLVGAEGIFAGWDYNGALAHSESKSTDRFDSGYVLASAFSSAIATGQINPFGPSDAAGAALLAGTQARFDGRTAKSKADSIDAHISKGVFDLAGGPLSIALGTELRREKLSDQASDQLKAGAILNQDPSADSFGSRNVKALFREANAPLTSTIEAQAAVRYDSYSDVGSSTNPKVGLRWQPAKQWLFRASAGTGFRAPTLSDLRASTTTSTTAGVYDDPLRCGQPGAVPDQDCANQFQTTSGGNENLKPEKSKQFSFGFVWGPTASFSASIDYWRIKKTDVIATLSDALVFGDPTKYSTNIQRGSVDPAAPNLPGPIVDVNLPKLNYGTELVSGLDIELGYRMGATDYGKFSTHLSGTYLLQSKQQREPGGETVSNLGVFFDTYARPRWKHRISLDWSSGAWSSVLGNTFQNGYTDQNPPPYAPQRRVKFYSLWDTQVAYNGVKNLKLSAGIQNLFDTKPPFSNQSYWYIATYDPTYADPRGRLFYASATYSFK